jgi:hypothetical protein
MTKVIEIQDKECPFCAVKCKSLAGLSKHMNAMHLMLSPNQADQADKRFKKL